MVLVSVPQEQREKLADGIPSLPLYPTTLLEMNSDLRSRDTGHLLLICPLSEARVLAHCSKVLFEALPLEEVLEITQPPSLLQDRRGSCCPPVALQGAVPSSGLFTPNPVL